MSENYSGAMLHTDVNDGHIPANDVEKDRYGNYIVNGKNIGFGHFMLLDQRQGEILPCNAVLEMRADLTRRYKRFYLEQQAVSMTEKH